MSIFEYFFRILAPHHCLQCGSEGSLLCQNCAAALPAVPQRCYRCAVPTTAYGVCSICRIASPLTAVMPATFYRGPAKDLVHQLKFERAQAAAAEMAGIITCRLSLPSEEAVLLTHIPTAPQRIRTRGYDQTQLLTRALSRQMRIRCTPLLGRSGNQRQVGQDRVTRKTQMEHVFYVRPAVHLKGRHILLVDDVLTTGATCEAAARLLLQAGAARVDAVVFAVA